MRGPATAVIASLQLSRRMGIIDCEMKTSLGYLGLAFAAASLLSAQEYKIQLHRPSRAGQEFEISYQYQSTHRMSVSLLGKTAPEQLRRVTCTD